MARYNRIHSKIEDISNLLIHPIPTKPIGQARVVRVGSTVVMVGQFGTVYSSAADTAVHWQRTSRMENTVLGLQKLGLLSKAAWDQHKAAEKEEQDASTKRYAAKEALRVHKHLGLKLPAATVKHLRTLVTERDLLEIDSGQ